MKMTATDKKAWLDALRSGKYLQGQGYLHYQRAPGVDSFCCLGVLCEVQKLPPARVSLFDGTVAENAIAYGGTCSTLPISLIDKFQCNDESIDDQFKRMSLLGKLMTMNDDAGATFNEIADYLETAIEVIESYPS